MVPALLKTALGVGWGGVLVKVNISHGAKACSFIRGCLKAKQCPDLLMDTKDSGVFQFE